MYIILTTDFPATMSDAGANSKLKTMNDHTVLYNAKDTNIINASMEAIMLNL